MLEDVFTMPVHSAAEVFPMLGDDELDELAADIKENGLQQPLVVKDGTLIDGRNRREACRRAGVMPKLVQLNGQDPEAFIISANIHRRHLTKGQRAMAVARIYPEPEKGGRGKKSFVAKEFSIVMLSKARDVLKWAPELADGVRTAAHSLDHAYEIASDRKTKAEAPTLRLQALRATDPDLADAVIEERQQLEAAEDQARGRRQREREKRQGIYDALIHIDRFFFVIGDPDHQRYIKDVCTEHPKELPIDRVMISINNWRTAIDVLEKTLTE